MPRRRRTFAQRERKGLWIDFPNDVAIQVTVNHDGIFWAEWEGDSYNAPTFEGLKKKLQPVVRTDLKRVAVPATFVSYNGEREDVTLVGLHGGNGNVLFVNHSDESKKGAIQQGNRWGNDRFYRPFTEADRIEHNRLKADVETANKLLKRFLKARTIEPVNEVRKALKLPPLPRKQPDDD